MLWHRIVWPDSAILGTRGVKDSGAVPEVDRVEDNSSTRMDMHQFYIYIYTQPQHNTMLVLPRHVCVLAYVLFFIAHDMV